MDGPGMLEAGAEALAEGDWTAAREAFGAASEADPEDPDALVGLGAALWWSTRVAEAPAVWERAYAGYRRRSDPAHAALVAVNLSLTYRSNFGNDAAAAGWAARAERLADEAGLAPVRGWALMTRAMVSAGPDEAMDLLDEARSIASEHADRDLELCVIAARGSTLVDQGRVAEATPLLDEAMAATLGGDYGVLDTVVFTSCVLVQSCYRCADFRRVVQWVRALRGFIERYGHPYVNSLCRAHYGAVLVATGDWDAAGEELSVALDMAADSLPSVRGEACAFLAELHLCRGRPEEAAAVLQEFEDQPVAVPVLAATRLALGDPEGATALAAEFLARTGERPLLVARAAEVLGEAGLALGDARPAREHGPRLAQVGRSNDCDLVAARGERLWGIACTADGQVGEARRHLAAAADAFSRLEMPWEMARTRMFLAELLATEDPAGARECARRAHTTFRRLGDDRGAAAAAERMGHDPAAGGDPEDGDSPLSPREQEVLALVAEGLPNPEIADRLYVSRRTVEHHVEHILAKLDVRNRTEAAAWAVQHARTT